MRTLKKILSLMLVLAMVLRLATTAFAKTSFPDDADIKYEEAAAVISSIGLLVGDETGKYQPGHTMARGGCVCDCI